MWEVDELYNLITDVADCKVGTVERATCLVISLSLFFLFLVDSLAKDIVVKTEELLVVPVDRKSD